MTIPPPFWLKLTVALQFAACPSTAPRSLLFFLEGMENEEDGRRGELERGTEVGHLSEDGYTFAGLCKQLDAHGSTHAARKSLQKFSTYGASFCLRFRSPARPAWGCVLAA